MKTVVKAYALVCLALVTGSAVLAQQQHTEWRASIAEDNKAATLDDTLKFVVGTANDRTVNRARVPEDSQTWLEVLEKTFGALSSAKCSIEWSELYVFDDTYQEILNRSKYVADLSKVDPLSLAVTPFRVDSSVTPYRAGTYVRGFLVTLSGTSGSQFADVMKFDREVHKDIPGRETDIPEAESAPASCAGVHNGAAVHKKDKCSITQSRESHTELFLANQEAAHRVARALMHAALLCGGVKAVSPF